MEPYTTLKRGPNIEPYGSLKGDPFDRTLLLMI